jgi:uncharacterized protein YuzE
MNIKYFPDTDTALLELSERPVAETIEISENLYLDLDEAGNPVNLTIEHARTTARLPDLSFTQIETRPAVA